MILYKKDINSLNAILHKHSKNAERKQRKCFYPNCSEKCNQSHLLQENGIISNISNNENKVVELNFDNFFDEINIQFKKKGKNESFKQPLFCKSHDDLLFTNIEKQKKQIDFNSYETFLLFSIRACLNEIRKKEIVIDYNQYVLDDERLILNINPLIHTSEIEASRLGIQDLLNDIQKLYSDYFHGVNKFRNYEYCYLALPKDVAIAASALFTYETSQELIENKEFYSKNPTTTIFFHLLPLKTETVLLFGYESDRKYVVRNYLSDFLSRNPDKILKKISNILIMQINTWIVSEKFYENQIKPKEKEIINWMYKNRNIQNVSNERIDIDLNIFS